MALLIYCHSLVQVQGGSQFHISLDGDIISPYLNGRKEIPPFDGTWDIDRFLKWEKMGVIVTAMFGNGLIHSAHTSICRIYLPLH